MRSLCLALAIFAFPAFAINPVIDGATSGEDLSSANGLVEALMDPAIAAEVSAFRKTGVRVQSTDAFHEAATTEGAQVNFTTYTIMGSISRADGSYGTATLVIRQSVVGSGPDAIISRRARLSTASS